MRISERLVVNSRTDLAKKKCQEGIGLEVADLFLARFGKEHSDLAQRFPMIFFLEFNTFHAVTPSLQHCDDRSFLIISIPGNVVREPCFVHAYMIESQYINEK